jgi:hypothetical protein
MQADRRGEVPRARRRHHERAQGAAAVYAGVRERAAQAPVGRARPGAGRGQGVAGKKVVSRPARREAASVHLLDPALVAVYKRRPRNLSTYHVSSQAAVCTTPLCDCLADTSGDLTYSSYSIGVIPMTLYDELNDLRTLWDDYVTWPALELVTRKLETLLTLLHWLGVVLPERWARGGVAMRGRGWGRGPCLFPRSCPFAFRRPARL